MCVWCLPTAPPQRWLDLSGHERHAVATPLGRAVPGGARECPSLQDARVGWGLALPSVSFEPGQTLAAATPGVVKTVALVARHRSVVDCMMLFGQARTVFCLLSSPSSLHARHPPPRGRRRAVAVGACERRGAGGGVT